MLLPMPMNAAHRRRRRYFISAASFAPLAAILLGAVHTADVHAAPPDFDTWLNAESERSARFVNRGAAPPDGLPGAVIASPSRTHPDYYYNWVRDASLATFELVRLYLAAPSSSQKADYLTTLKERVAFTNVIQGKHTLTGLGEPKFYVDGDPYNGPWGRPQDDGPAARAMTFAWFAQALLDEGDETYVRSELYDGTLPTRSIIKSDLEYLARRWNEPSFDAWEEVLGFHFSTQVLERRALLDGALLATRLGDSGAAAYYLDAAHKLEALIAQHWDPARGIVVDTLNVISGPDYKTSGLDVTVILAPIYGAGLFRETDDQLFPPTDDRILATAHALEARFQDLYPINHAGFPGIAIGRYPEDQYDGYATRAKGNPWVLATAGFAQFYFELAHRFRRNGSITFDPLNKPFFDALAVPGLVTSSGSIAASNPIFAKVVSALSNKGQSFLECIRAHTGQDGSLSEQMNRDTGVMQGAPDLTLSYGTFLGAIASR